MVVVIVRDDHSINSRYVLDLAWDFCVTLGAKPGEWAATLTKDRIEEYAEALGKFNEIAGMA